MAMSTCVDLDESSNQELMDPLKGQSAIAERNLLHLLRGQFPRLRPLRLDPCQPRPVYLPRLRSTSFQLVQQLRTAMTD